MTESLGLEKRARQASSTLSLQGSAMPYGCFRGIRILPSPLSPGLLNLFPVFRNPYISAAYLTPTSCPSQLSHQKDKQPSRTCLIYSQPLSFLWTQPQDRQLGSRSRGEIRKLAPFSFQATSGHWKSNHQQSIQGTFETALICPLLPLTFSLYVSLNPSLPLSLLLVPRWLGGDLHFQPNPLTPLRAIIPE